MKIAKCIVIIISVFLLYLLINGICPFESEQIERPSFNTDAVQSSKTISPLKFFQFKKYLYSAPSRRNRRNFQAAIQQVNSLVDI